ncbi:MAG: lysophospholipid acyltransferase family protein [Mariniphaga sp.]|nr:lysophospholipid acyltransferase family protein [Mariniphaga sp.]MDD4227033.1 lysophospholipid acyltransferase family protein [Mariniphaga sp.]
MNSPRQIAYYPLAFFRLLFIGIITAVIVVVGWFWLHIFGFSRRLQHCSMSIWGKSILFICGIKVIKNKVPASSNFILMPNHRSYLDIFIISAFTPAAFVGKAELRNWPFLKTGARITNMIFVTRSDLQSLITTMNRIRSSVSQAIPVVIFPEGTTSRGPLTKPFKKGSFKIAADAGIPVIPMAVHWVDKNDAWVDDDTFVGHFFRQMGKPVSHVMIRYGDPLVHPDYKKLLVSTREQIDGMLIQIISDKSH